MRLLAALLGLLLACCASAAADYPQPPYPPSGWRPEGRQFSLPSGQYGPPPPAAPTTTEAAETTTTELPSTAAPSDAVVAGSQSGVYYLLQPDGRLQRVSYAHGPAPAASPLLPERLTLAAEPGYLASFHYQDLLPHGAPVYAYRQPELVRIS